MSWFIIVAVIILVMAAVVAVGLLKKPAARTKEHPYRRIDALFTPAERSFFGVLNQAVGNSAAVFGKVRVADVIAPEKGMPRGDWQRAFNRISSKHFDFLLCDKENLSVLCAIELNDASHSSEKRKRRDEFLSGVCEAAGVPLIQLAAKAAYSVSEIQSLLSPHVPFDAARGKIAIELEKSMKTCPKCSSEMVRRVAKKGKYAGKHFWACSAYPKCKYIEAANA